MVVEVEECARVEVAWGEECVMLEEWAVEWVEEV